MSSLLTIALFLTARYLHKRWAYLLFIPVFFTVAGCILVLLAGHISFDRYFEENRPLTFMLKPAVVALGVLMYKQWMAVKDNFKPMFITILFSSLLSVTSV